VEAERHEESGDIAVAAAAEDGRALTEAIAMYRKAGYAEIEPFNDELYAHHWFERKLRA